MLRKNIGHTRRNASFNFKLVARLQGSLLMLESLFFLLCIAMSVYYGEETSWAFCLCGIWSGWYLARTRCFDCDRQTRRIGYRYRYMDNILFHRASALLGERIYTVVYRCFFRDYVGFYHYRLYHSAQYRGDTSQSALLA